ncbi:hypothetical protein GA830_10560 [Mesorhizobium sp. NBSH29]|uniref:phage head-tail joining protein n=1 Tax=Mesorhizobium sp. NBSH29 TaxID=2654249 RepID=UPI00189647E2|nr:hypothetical protein [Mesorhizobium sp. NBSH29]QPC87135.1 hypothetical protein GA830_10560 [Mesorhizobium sp. NBSH29]
MADELTVDEKKTMLRDLRIARYSGAKRIKFRERDVTYRTDEEMKIAIESLEAEISPAKRRRTSVASFSSGL